MARSNLKQLNLLVVATSLAAAVLVACSGGKNNERSEETQLAKAYRLIDQGQPIEAINLLTAELGTSRDPEATEALRTGLASAYVSKAGLSAHKFYGFARAWMQEQGGDENDFSFFKSPLQNDLAEFKGQEASGQASNSALEIFEANGLQTLAFFLSVKSRFDALPVINDDQEADLSMAIEVLAPLARPSKGAALYRGLLKTVRFKHHTHKGIFQGQSPANPKKPAGSPAMGDCWLGKLDFLSGLDVAVGEAEEILEDLAIAFPRQGSSIADALNGAGQARANLKSLMTEVRKISPADSFQISEVIRFARLQMGWDWVCE